MATDFNREDDLKLAQPPDDERVLRLAYDIRSTKSHEVTRRVSFVLFRVSSWIVVV